MPVEKWKLKEYNQCYCYERNGTVYTYVFHKRQTTPLTWMPENKALALQFLRIRVEEHLGIKEKPKTLKDLLVDYNRNKLPLLAATSQKKINEVFKWLLDIENYQLNQTADIRNAILLNLSKRELAINTKINYFKYLKSLFNYGIENNLLLLSPINKSIIPKAEKLKISAFKVEEIEAILGYLNNKHTITFGVVLFSRYFGTRINETLSLQWNDIENGNVTFQRKGGKYETLPYSMFPELAHYIDSMPRLNKRLFPISSQKAGAYFKKAIVKLNEIYEDAREKGKDAPKPINENLSFHGIRKMRENELIKTYKNDITLVARLMGHTVAVQQKHYFEVLSVDEIRDNLKFSV